VPDGARSERHTAAVTTSGTPSYGRGLPPEQLTAPSEAEFGAAALGPHVTTGPWERLYAELLRRVTECAHPPDEGGDRFVVVTATDPLRDGEYTQLSWDDDDVVIEVASGAYAPAMLAAGAGSTLTALGYGGELATSNYQQWLPADADPALLARMLLEGLVVGFGLTSPEDIEIAPQ
jgi:hypothetical protein